MKKETSAACGGVDVSGIIYLWEPPRQRFSTSLFLLKTHIRTSSEWDRDFCGYCSKMSNSNEYAPPQRRNIVTVKMSAEMITFEEISLRQ